MLVLLALTAIAGTGLPEVEVRWKGSDAVLIVEGPAGEHVALDAPADLELSWDGGWLSLGGMGADVVDGVRLREARGATVTGSLRVSVCEDAGSACRLIDAIVEAPVPDTKKGVLSAVVRAPDAAPAESSEPSGDDEPAHIGSYAEALRRDAGEVHAAAVTRATADDKLLLLDFSAVWCPPCNLMSAEVLHAPELPDVLDHYVLAVLDVDDKSSWPIKDRYHVGGYPTLIVAKADGTEIARHLGYRGPEELTEWLQYTVDRGTSERLVIDAGPEAVTAKRAAEIAWKLLSAGEEDVSAWMKRAASAEDTVAFRKARVSLDPNTADVVWLTEHAPETVLEWIDTDAPAEDEAGRMALRAAIDAGLRTADPLEAADLLYLAADLRPEADKPLLYGAAAASVRGVLTGDPIADRGHYTWLARLTELSGDVDGAVALLDAATQTFADEPTFLLSATKILVRAERGDEALERSTLGLERSWGDNYLRMAAAHSDALVAAGQTDEARAFALRTLAAAERPAQGTDVRTFRYLDHLAERAKGE